MIRQDLPHHLFQNRKIQVSSGLQCKSSGSSFRLLNMREKPSHKMHHIGTILTHRRNNHRHQKPKSTCEGVLLHTFGRAILSKPQHCCWLERDVNGEPKQPTLILKVENSNEDSNKGLEVLTGCSLFLTSLCWRSSHNTSKSDFVSVTMKFAATFFFSFTIHRTLYDSPFLEHVS